jgi:hypothetical protein
MSVQGKTLTAIAAGMWDHAPRMAAAGAPFVQLTADQMRDLVSSFWAAKFATTMLRAARRICPALAASSPERRWFPCSGVTGRACWIK